MNIISVFRNDKIVKYEIEKIHWLVQNINKEIKFMEVCGTHTMQISRFGIRKLMPKNIELTSGPGCPVCVTPISYIDKAIYLSRQKDVIIVTFGDMFRVPGTESSLELEKSSGANIEILYSPIEVIDLARKFPNKIIVFLSIGFETTMPAIAVTVQQIKQQKINNVYFLLGNKFFLPAMEVLILKSRNFLPPSIENESSIDGFILPGHLSSIVGEAAYGWISEKYKIAGVITGFEPVDIVRGIRMLLEQIVSGKPEIKNEYTRVVQYDGNSEAMKIIKNVFEPTDTEWRGLGIVPSSGARFNKEYEEFDIEKKISVPKLESKEYKGCQCADVLIGKIKPFECKLFAKVCTPENPLGACMVSSEGSCAAYYKYERG